MVRIQNRFASEVQSVVGAFAARRPGHFDSYLALAAPLLVLCVVTAVSLASRPIDRQVHPSAVPGQMGGDPTNALTAAAMPNYAW